MEEPFSGAIRDGRLYGRGSQDMKGSLAAMIAAAKALVDARISLAGDVLLTAVADEEYLSEGASTWGPIPCLMLKARSKFTVRTPAWLADSGVISHPVTAFTIPTRLSILVLVTVLVAKKHMTRESTKIRVPLALAIVPDISSGEAAG